jgi:primase-polymerase (primpol)-like protein
MTPEHTQRERFTAYAETLRARFNEGILKDMQEKPLWVLWKPERDPQGNIHKRPYTPRNFPASIYKPRQWATLDNVLEVLATGNFHVAGIGIMLPAPYVLIDKDAKEDAPIYDPQKRKIVSALALRLLEQVASYAELSPNNGLHIITEGRPKRGNFKTEALEMYTNWFSTVTTRHIPGTPLEVINQQASIQALEDDFHPPIPQASFQNTGVGVGSGNGLTELPPEAATDAQLQRLLHGDMTDYPSQSSADFVLIMKLLHWTGDDKVLTRQLFLASPLGKREKAQRKTGATTYVDMTIENVLKKRRNPPQSR